MLDTEIAFASPADRAAFAEEMAAAVTNLAAKYHQSDGRAYRVVVGAYPRQESDHAVEEG